MKLNDLDNWMNRKDYGLFNGQWALVVALFIGLLIIVGITLSN